MHYMQDIRNLSLIGNCKSICLIQSNTRNYNFKLRLVYLILNNNINCIYKLFSKNEKNI